MRSHVAVIVLVTGLFHATGFAAVADGLYDVGVPVTDQGQVERRRAVHAALLEMLSRATGLVEIPRNDAIRDALSDPGRFYTQYRYDRHERDDGPELELVVSFAPPAVSRLVAAAALPLWGANRPTVIAWLVSDDAGQREVLGAASDHPVLVALRDQARRRGLSLVVPLMDLDDQLSVPAAAVVGGLAQVLEAGSERYAGDLLLIAEISQQADQSWTAGWEFWLRDAELELTATDSDPQAVGSAGADLVANELAGRYAVYTGAERLLQVQIRGVASLSDYGGLLEYLDTLEFVESVQIRELNETEIDVDLVSSTDWPHFLELLSLDGRLAPLAQAIGAERKALAWHGDSDDD